MEAGRDDLSSEVNRRWFVGALRKRALFDRRTAARRRIREQHAAPADTDIGESAEFPMAFVAQLPPKLRTTALLALAGHSKREILWLLRMNEPALRQRAADIRRRWRAQGDRSIDRVAGLSGALVFGLIRRALLPSARATGVALASHDPDGHLSVASTSQKRPARQRAGSWSDLKE